MLELKTNEEIASFVIYPAEFLLSFAMQIQEPGEHALDIMDIKELRQLKGLFKLDNFALSLAAEYGVHPITGCEWHVKFDGIDAEKYHALISRNFKMIEDINEKLRELEEE